MHMRLGTAWSAFGCQDMSLASDEVIVCVASSSGHEPKLLLDNSVTMAAKHPHPLPPSVFAFRVAWLGLMSVRAKVEDCADDAQAGGGVADVSLDEEGDQAVFERVFGSASLADEASPQALQVGSRSQGGVGGVHARRIPAPSARRASLRTRPTPPCSRLLRRSRSTLRRAPPQVARATAMTTGKFPTS